MSKLYRNKSGELYTKANMGDGFSTIHFSDELLLRYPNIKIKAELPSNWKFLTKKLQYFHEEINGRNTIPTKCPICGDPCFFYQNEYGSKVFFDELGSPWKKHPCTSSRALTESETKKLDELWKKSIASIAASEEKYNNLQKIPGSVMEIQNYIQTRIRLAMDDAIKKCSAAPLIALYNKIPTKWQPAFQAYVKKEYFPFIWKTKDGISKLSFSLKKAKEIAKNNNVDVTFGEKFDSNNLTEEERASLQKIANLARAAVNNNDWTKMIERKLLQYLS